MVPTTFEFLEKEISEYPSFCGAGKGIGDKIVDEFIGGRRCSHICHAHDDSWNVAEPSVVGFIVSNAMFAFNLFTYLMRPPGGVVKQVWRAVKGSMYVLAVSTIGWRIFKQLKKAGGDMICPMCGIKLSPGATWCPCCHWEDGSCGS